jgi:hypothetical protein
MALVAFRVAFRAAWENMGWQGPFVVEDTRYQISVIRYQEEEISDQRAATGDQEATPRTDLKVGHYKC